MSYAAQLYPIIDFLLYQSRHPHPSVCMHAWPHGCVDTAGCELMGLVWALWVWMDRTWPNAAHSAQLILTHYMSPTVSSPPSKASIALCDHDLCHWQLLDRWRAIMPEEEEEEEEGEQTMQQIQKYLTSFISHAHNAHHQLYMKYQSCRLLSTRPHNERDSRNIKIANFDLTSMHVAIVLYDVVNTTICSCSSSYAHGCSVHVCCRHCGRISFIAATATCISHYHAWNSHLSICQSAYTPPIHPASITCIRTHPYHDSPCMLAAAACAAWA